jgi:septal ring factor EnvC (AmiA/AmiB activator)
LKSLLIDTERSKLVKKLSEANQQNRFLKRQLKTQEHEITNIKTELALMELEVQVFISTFDFSMSRSHYLIALS